MGFELANEWKVAQEKAFVRRLNMSASVWFKPAFCCSLILPLPLQFSSLACLPACILGEPVQGAKPGKNTLFCAAALVFCCLALEQAHQGARAKRGGDQCITGLDWKHRSYCHICLTAILLPFHSIKTYPLHKSLTRDNCGSTTFLALYIYIILCFSLL